MENIEKDDKFEYSKLHFTFSFRILYYIMLKFT